MKKGLICFGFMLLVSTVGFTQNPKVKLDLNTNSIRIGEQINVKITVNDTENVILPKLELHPALEIVDSTKVDTIKNMIIKRYTITGFDSGAYYIPRQQVFIRNQAFLTDSILINVATVKVDTTQVKKYPIKNIQEEPYVFDDFKLYIYLLLAALAIIGFWIYYFVIRKKKPEEEKPTYRTLPPLEEAMHHLKELDEKLLWQNNQVKAYYSELTDIIRTYIEKELQIPALERTSEEIIDMLKDLYHAETVLTSKEIIEKLRQLFKEADLVKFAKSKPIANEIEEDRRDAEDIIKNLNVKTASKEEDELE